MNPAHIYSMLHTDMRAAKADLQPAFKHFTKLHDALAASGPAFAAAAAEADRVAGILQLHIAACKYDAAQEDRHSDSYREGYRTGIVWDQKKHNYRPGGPWVYRVRDYETDHKLIAMALAAEQHARRWLMGFDEGLAAQVAGHKATPDMVACGLKHRHVLACLGDRMRSVA